MKNKLKKYTMKTIILTLSSILLLSCNSVVKDNNANVQSNDTNMVKTPVDLSVVDPIILDSIIVENKFVNTPFDKNDDMKYFNKIISKQTKVNVELKEGYEENVMDTVKTIYWDKSYIEILTNKTTDRFLQYAIINDNNIVLRNNIRIGQDLKTVCSAFNIKYDPEKMYKYIELTTTSEEAGTYLTFYFKENILVSIVYSPYTG